MYILSESGVGFNFFRGFFGLLDTAIYSFIPIVYNLIEDLAHVSILTMTEMDEFAGRIYTLLGLFMLFKVSFSIVTYIINPDKMLDKQSGIQNVIKNVIIVLIMIISTPAAFNLLYDVQSAILKDQVIPKFILGMGEQLDDSNYVFNIYPVDENGVGCSDSSLVEDTGNYVSLMIFRGFFQLETSVADMENDRYNEFLDDYCFVSGGYTGQENEYLTVQYYTRDSDIYNKSEEEGVIINSGLYYVDYKILMSTAVGVVVLLLFVSMCFDVATRSIRLTFLQLISPIPIVSYIDPNSAKQGMFKRWITEVLKTWANLFIRLAAIYFAIYLIQELNENFAVINGWEIKSYDWVIDLFLIIGILFFAKQLPSLLEELIPGLKLGKMTLNPFKKIGDEALGGKFISRAPIAAAGIAGAGLVGGIAAGAARANTVDGNKFKKGLFGLGSGIAGGVTSAFRGGRAAFTTDKGGFNKAMQASGRAAQGIYNRAGTSFSGRNIARMQQGLGLKTGADVFDQEVKDYDKFAEISDSINKAALSSVERDNAFTLANDHYYKTADGMTKVINSGTNYAYEKAGLESVISSDSATGVEKADAQARLSALEKVAKQQYIDSVKAGTIDDYTIKSSMDQLTQLGQNTTSETVQYWANELNASTDYASKLSDATKGANGVKAAKAQMTADPRYSQAQTNREYANGQKKG